LTSPNSFTSLVNLGGGSGNVQVLGATNLDSNSYSYTLTGTVGASTATANFQIIV
jgi:hypothetical protein